MNKSVVLFFSAMILSASSAMAVPAKPTPYLFTQPDGTSVELRKVGDERGHVILTSDGYPVMRDDAGFYRFVTLDKDGKVGISGIKAASLASLTGTERTVVESADSKVVCSALAAYRANLPGKAPSMLPAQSGVGLVDNAFLGRKDLNGLVILAEFSDKAFADGNDREFFAEMLNREGFDSYGATGSARDYFIDSSSGQFNPTFDVYGPVTLPHPYSYYGKNNNRGSDSNAAQMIADACTLLDEQIDFSDYDLDGDGKVDNVFVFYAGFGEASYGDDDTVWPHKWDLRSAGISCTLDGVSINDYACSNELEKDSYGNTVPGGIGTFVHEFSHVLGLPDLYVTTDYGGYWTPGYWSVLDSGPYNNEGRTPPAYSIYERNALGWIDPIVITGPESISLEAINESNAGCLIPTASDSEFFLIENRQQTGWDKYLPGHGMLIWHIDFNLNKWIENTVNNNVYHQCVDIEEACGRYVDIYDYVVDDYYVDVDAYQDALAAYAFPGTTNATSFTDDTTPSMLTWDGRSLGLPITDITETDGVITFNVAGGRCDVAVPITKEAVDVSDGSFVASWLPSEGASGYLLTVEAEDVQGSERKVVADFGSSSMAELPEGWTFINNTGETYTSSGNFGESSPSFKIRKDGSGFMTEEFDGYVKSVEFWYKGQSTDSKARVIVEGKSDDTWVPISEVTVTNNVAATHLIEDIPNAVTQLRITYGKGLVGNLAIDDVTVTYVGAGTVVLPDYRSLDVGNVTSYLVDKLMPGATKYSYKVAAVDAQGRRSAFSEPRTVDLGGNSGVEAIGTDASGAFAVDGMTVDYSGAAGDRVVIYDLSGRTAASSSADGDGKARLGLPVGGTYVIVSPRLSAKFTVK